VVFGNLIFSWMLGIVLIGPLLSCYSTRQAYWQTSLLLGRQPLEEVQSVSAEDKALIYDILASAKALGLNVGTAYQHVVFPKENAVSWLFSASEALALKPYEWWFPIVGKVPYKGFYSRSERDEESMEFSRKGYDVYKTSVAAYSSLGWFPDPVFPSMLKRPRYQVIELFFHELTHRTIWLNESTEINENLAEFIAGKATIDFLKARNETNQLDQYSRYISDKKNYGNWLKNLEDELAKLYETSSLDDAAKIKAKYEIIEKYFQIRPKAEEVDFYGEIKNWNNARILASHVYLTHQQLLEEALRCRKDLKEFIVLVAKRRGITKAVICGNDGAQENRSLDIKTIIGSIH